MGARQSVFLTGATGFIGRHLLARLQERGHETIHCLIREGHDIAARSTSNGPVRYVRGDLFSTEAYGTHLTETDTVIHLAAVTGKADPKAYFRVNTEGTKSLLEQCKKAGVKNFLYASTIAVKYENKSRYLYAQSKERGEELVKQSGLNYCIVRPTIVLGPEAPAWENFSKLGQLPLLPVLGNGRTQIQPIYISDLVDCLLAILDEDRFRNEIFDLGGPEKTTIQDFLRTIHKKYRGKQPKIVHVPLAPLTAILSVMENVFYSILPINSGQLSAFRYDSLAESNRILNACAPKMKNVDAMLQEMISNGHRHRML